LREANDMDFTRLRRAAALIAVVVLLPLAYANPMSATHQGASDRSLASIAIDPVTNTVSLNSAFSLDIQVRGGSYQVAGVSACLSFDPAYLHVVDAGGNEANDITPGAALPRTMRNSADNALGRIQFEAAMDLGGAPAGGTFVLATIRFKAIAATPSGGTGIVFLGGSDVLDSQGNSVLGSTSNGSVVVVPVAAGPRVYLPMVLKEHPAGAGPTATPVSPAPTPSATSPPTSTCTMTSQPKPSPTATVPRPSLYTRTNAGIVRVSLAGEKRFVIADYHLGSYSIEILNDELYVDRWGLRRIEVYSLNGDYRRAVSIPPEVGYYYRFVIVPDGRIALLDNQSDRMYFISPLGTLLATVNILDGADDHWQNVDGVVVDHRLIFSEDGNKHLLQIDLNTYQRSIFKDLSHLDVYWLGAITYARGHYYVLGPTQLYALDESAVVITIAELEYGITGIAVIGDFAYVSSYSAGRIYKVDLITRVVSVLISGLDHPGDMEALL